MSPRAGHQRITNEATFRCFATLDHSTHGEMTCQAQILVCVKRRKNVYRYYKNKHAQASDNYKCDPDDKRACAHARLQKHPHTIDHCGVISVVSIKCCPSVLVVCR